MSAADIPQWATDRAMELSELCNSRACLLRNGDMAWSKAVNAFAAYIAAHEEPPVDPLLIEAREIVATTQHDWPESPWHINEVTELRAGNRDRNLTVMAAYEGLKRGVELAKATGS